MVVVVVAAEDVAVVVVELVLVLLLEVFDLAGVALGGWKPRSLSFNRTRVLEHVKMRMTRGMIKLHTRLKMEYSCSCQRAV